MQDLLISVLMGVYHPSKDIRLLERSIRSILDQTVFDLELVICDDGSSTEASSYLDSVATKDGRIVLVRPGGVQLLPQKLNHCLREAKGTYIARMDDDDFSHPDRFAKQIAFLETHPEIDFVGSNVRMIQNGVPAGTRILPERPTVRDFYMTQPFIHPALMFRRKILSEVGGYPEDNRSVLCEDYDLLLRLYAKGHQGANLQEVYLDYTVPVTAKGGRKMSHRWNEAVTRYRRFRELGVLPAALPYVVKPLAVGLLPEKVLGKIKKRRSAGG